MRRKDFYIGLLVITLSLHILGFMASPHNLGDFRTYLSWDPIISASFTIELMALIILILSNLFQVIATIIKNDPDK